MEKTLIEPIKEFDSVSVAKDGIVVNCGKKHLELSVSGYGYTLWLGIGENGKQLPFNKVYKVLNDLLKQELKKGKQ